MAREFKRLLDPIVRRISNICARGYVNLVNDAAKLQRIQSTFLDNETRDNIERFQQYGLTSNPHPGAGVVALFLNGAKDNPIIICVDDKRYRLQGLETGEVALYTDEGDSIILKRGNNIEINTQTLTVNAPAGMTVNAPFLKCTGDIQDNYDTQPDSLAEMRTKYNIHVHDENDSGGPTDAPSNTMGA